MTYVSETLLPGSGTISLRLRQFARWWSDEFRSAVPATWRPLLDGRAMPTVFVWRDGDCVRCELTADKNTIQERFLAAAFGPSTLPDWLTQQGFRRDQILLGPVLAQDLFLQRHLRVPSEALASLPRILDQEVERRTPFLLSDIWHAAVPASNEASRGAVALRHWIISRERAADAVAAIGLAMEDVDFLAARIDSGDAVAVVPLRKAPSAIPPWAVRTIKSLAMALLGAIVLGLLAFEWCQGGVASELEAALLEAKRGVQGGQSRSGQLTRLYALKADTGFVGIWNELSRILPDDTFLTDVRMKDGLIIISGYSSQAARLVRIIDQSPMFSSATLIAAIVPDTNEAKDRFRIKFQLRSARPSQYAWKSDR